VSKSHFRVAAELDCRGKFVETTVTVHRGANVVEVRPLRRRKSYSMMMAEVATMIYRTQVAREVAATKTEKKLRVKRKAL
jgi:hypothetical protein